MPESEFIEHCKNNTVDRDYWSGKIDNENIDLAFCHCCKHNDISLIRWFRDQVNVNIHCDQDMPFIWACGNGARDVAQYLYEQGNVNTNTIYGAPFRWACGGGHTSIAQWLLNHNSKIDIRVLADEAFRWTKTGQHLHTAIWLTTLCDSYSITPYPGGSFDINIVD